MKRINLPQLVLSVLVLFLLTGCAATIPVTYAPQNFVRFQGSADIGTFTYVPASQGKVKANQLQNTAVGSIFIALDVADLVKRATALELEKSGVTIGDKSPIRISGDVLELKAADLGYSVDWTYSVRYKITQSADGTTLLEKTYSADPKKTGKFGLPSDYGPSINEMILSGYDKFARDPEARKHLEKH
ncbi:MAG TPA: integrase [Candidatus Limnocylindria bacterium]|nr:integrase [Candidatus Limnocylindria bacterium]